MDIDRPFALRVHHLLAVKRAAVHSWFRLVVAACLMLLGFSAHALVPAVNAITWTADVGTIGVASSYEEACKAGMGAIDVAWGWEPGFAYARVSSRVFNPGGSCSLPNGYIVRFSVAPPSCPANSTSVSGGCQCTAPTVENSGHTACVAPPSKCVALKGTSAGDYIHDSGVNDAGTAPLSGDFSLSVDGCKVEVSNPHCVKNQAGWFQCTGEAIYSGDSCASAVDCASRKPFGEPAATPTPPEPNPPPNPDPSVPTPKPENPAPAPCPAGQAPGTFNGTAMCQPAGAEGTAGTSQGGIRNPDGSGSDVTNTTKCTTGAKCTTDSTTCTVLAGGAAGSCSTTTTTGTVQSVCDKDKGNSVCAAGAGGSGTASAFGGDCAKGFKAVSDDVVQNAMAEEQYKRNCQFFGVDVDPQSTANKAKSGADGQNTDTMKAAAANAPVTIQTFDAQGRGWGRSCPADTSIPLSWAGGRTFSIPFSRICTPLQLFALAGVALTMLGSFVWVMGGKK